jgi:hypothetical protein
MGRWLSARGSGRGSRPAKAAHGQKLDGYRALVLTAWPVMAILENGSGRSSVNDLEFGE